MSTNVPVKTVRATSAVGSVGIAMKHHLWGTWSEIAIANERAAWRIRIKALKHATPAKFMGDEMKPSLIAITAAAFALDALYGALKPICGDPVTSKDAKGWQHVLETFGHGFKLGRKASQWQPKFGSLFSAARDPAVHAKEAFATPVPHPLGGHAAPIYRTYSPKKAKEAVNLLMDVLDTLTSNPGPTTGPWASGARATVDRLLKTRKKTLYR